MAKRFEMLHGQFFADQLYRNVFWVINGTTMGYGDLRAQDIIALTKGLKEDEVFEGFNEHHGSQFQQTDYAMIKIENGVISFPDIERRKDGLPARERWDN